MFDEHGPPDERGGKKCTVVLWWTRTSKQLFNRNTSGGDKSTRVVPTDENIENNDSDSKVVLGDTSGTCSVEISKADLKSRLL